METMFMQNFGGKTKIIMVFLKVAYIQHVSNTVNKCFKVTASRPRSGYIWYIIRGMEN